MTHTPYPPTRPAAWTAALAGILLLALVPSLHAADPKEDEALPEDPVEQFRAALRLEQNPVYKSRPYFAEGEALKLAINFRRENLNKYAERLQTISDLSRALLLLEWRLYDRPTSNFELQARDIEQKVRDGLANRFVERVRQTIAKGSTDRQVAVANLVYETVNSAASLGEEQLSLYQQLAPLAQNLAQLSRSREPRVQAAAARALAQFPTEPKVVVPALRRLLASDQPTSTRRAAAESLRSLVQIVSGREATRRFQPGVSVVETRPTPQYFSREQIVAVAVVAVPVACKGLEDRSQPVREANALTLNEVATTMVELIRIELIRPTESPFPPPQRRWAPLERKRVEEGRQAVEVLLKDLLPVVQTFQDNSADIARAVRDKNPVVRRTARRVLDELGRARRLFIELSNSVPREKKEARGPRYPGRDLILVSGSAQPGPLAIPASLPAPSTSGSATPSAAPARLVRRQPPEELKEAGDPLKKLFKATGPLVARGLKDPDKIARRDAADALENMGEEAVEFIPQMVDALRDCDLFVGWSIARTLSKLAPRRADIVVPGLIPLVRTLDLDLRLAGINALAAYGPAAREAVPVLADAVNKGDIEARLAAIKAIESIGKPAVPALPALARALLDASPRIRLEAARVLGRFGPLAKDQLPALRRLTTDPDPGVRQAASEAILSITPQE